MKRWLVLVGLMSIGCQNEDPIPQGNVNQNQSVNVTIFGPGAVGPSPGSCQPAAVHLGCFNMVDPSGAALPDCSGGLAQYNAPAGSHGTIDVTPVDSNGNKLQGCSVQSIIPNGACTLSGETSGSDGFNPSITINAGTCIVVATVAGVPAQRTFVGE